ncbi:hypothetical protein BDQ12DRAFT_693100 [Crucibulum laeve]|uniref:Uncharacterized protein n=1 Tax=Crucibulum laeve TaxID=68775 RepID=A0A5C3LGN6_9AGAR|nr:hypothetical protein BDQ12DRAFT_693100 [Crucibulum laeve]
MYPLLGRNRLKTNPLAVIPITPYQPTTFLVGLPLRTSSQPQQFLFRNQVVDSLLIPSLSLFHLTRSSSLSNRCPLTIQVVTSLSSLNRPFSLSHPIQSLSRFKATVQLESLSILSILLETLVHPVNPRVNVPHPTVQLESLIHPTNQLENLNVRLARLAHQTNQRVNPSQLLSPPVGKRLRQAQGSPMARERLMSLNPLDVLLMLVGVWRRENSIEEDKTINLSLLLILKARVVLAMESIWEEEEEEEKKKEVN